MSTAEASNKGIETRRDQTGGLGTVGRLSGALGTVLAVSAPLTWFLTGESGVLLWGKLGLAGLLLAVYAVTNPTFWRRAVGSRSTGLLVLSGASVVVALALVGVVNYVAYKNPKQLDVTREGLYTLSDQTTKLLARLKEPVHVYAFFSSTDQTQPAVQETLRRYAAAGNKLTFELVDPQGRPDLVERYQVTDRGPRIVITARGQDARAKDFTEEELTNGIIKVAEQTAKTVHFLTGHGEADLDDAEGGAGYKAFADALRAEGYGVEELSLLTGREAQKGEKIQVAPPAAAAAASPGPRPDGAPGADELQKPGTAAPAAGAPGVAVPPSVSVLVVAGARSPLLAPEVAALERYLALGGRLVVLLEPNQDAGLGTLLAQWKVEPDKDLIVDTNPINRLIGFGPAAPMAQPSASRAEHAVVKDLTAPVVLVTARSLRVANGGLQDVEAGALLETGESSWGETNLVGGAAAFDDQDLPGPLAVMTLSTRSVSEADKRSAEARLLVAGDAEWLGNKYLGVQGNRDLAVNAAHWLAEEQERIAIRPRSRAMNQLLLSGAQMGQLRFIAQDILPVLLVALGMGIVLIRRKR